MHTQKLFCCLCVCVCVCTSLLQAGINNAGGGGASNSSAKGGGGGGSGGGGEGAVKNASQNGETDEKESEAACVEAQILESLKQIILFSKV